MTNSKGNLCGEICRICGWDNACLEYEIDTKTDRVTYRLCTYQRGVGATERLYTSYANAMEALENFKKML